MKSTKKFFISLMVVIVMTMMLIGGNAFADPSDPTNSEPTSSDPTNSDPTNSDPTSSDPTNSDPTNSDPTSSDPTNSDPTNSDPTSSDPTNSEPTSSDPTSSNPTSESEAKKITGANVTLKMPKAGDKVEKVKKMSGDYEYEGQSIEPDVSTTTEGLGVHAYWVEGLPVSNNSEDEPAPFYGTFEEGKDYYAMVDFFAKDGYELDEKFADGIKINGVAPAVKRPVFLYSNQCFVKITLSSKVESKEDVVKETQSLGAEDEVKVETKDETEASKAATEEVAQLISKIVAGEEVEGISTELAQKITEAISARKEIKIEVSTPKVDEEAVKEDAEKVKEKIGNNATVLGYYDIDVNVLIDGELAGTVTKLGDKITLTLAKPEDLPEVKAGFKRVFKVVKVHNGVATELETQDNGDNVTCASDEFSTYALVYEDVKETKNTKNPKTGDTIGITLAMMVISMAGVVVIKKLK